MEMVTRREHKLSLWQRIQIDALNQIGNLKDRFIEKCRRQSKLEAQMYEANTDGFAGIETGWMGYSHPEVIPHWPPQYIVSSQT